MNKKINKKKAVFIALASLLGAGLLVLAFLYLFYIPNLFESLAQRVDSELSVDTSYDFSEQSNGGSSSFSVELKKLLTGYEDVKLELEETHDSDASRIDYKLGGVLLAEMITDGEALVFSGDGEDFYGYDLDEKSLFEEAFRKSQIYKNKKGSFGIKDFNGNKRYLKGGCFFADHEDIAELLEKVGELAILPKNAEKADELIALLQGLGYDAEVPEDVADIMDELADAVLETEVSFEFKAYYSWFTLCVIEVDFGYKANNGEWIDINTVIDFDGESGVLFSSLIEASKYSNTRGSIKVNGELCVNNDTETGVVGYELTAEILKDGTYISNKDSKSSYDLTVSLTLDPNENESKLIYLLKSEGKKIVKVTLGGVYEDSEEKWGLSFESLVVNSINMSGVFEVSYSCTPSSEEISMPEYTDMRGTASEEVEALLSDIAEKIYGAIGLTGAKK